MTPDHYVTRLLHASGVGLDALGVGQGPLGEDRSRRRGGCCARTGTSTAARRCASGSSRSWPTSSTCPLRPSAADRRRDLRPARRAARRPTPTARARCIERFRIAVLATTDDPCDDLSAHAALAADPTWSGRVIPTFRPDRYLEPALPGWPDAVARAGRGRGRRHRRLRGLRPRAGGAPPVLRRARGDVGRPQPRRRPHRPARSRARPARIYRAALAADATPRRGGRVPAAHAAGDGADVLRRRAGDDAASGGAPRPPRARPTAAFGPDTGHDIPLRVEFTDALRPLLERYGTHPGLPPGRVHARRDGLLARARAAGRLLPLACTSACPGGSSTPRDAIRRFRAAVTETAGFSRTSGLRRRHPRVLLDPGPPRHVPPRRRRLARPARGRAPARRGRGRSRRRVDLVTRTADAGVQAVSARPRAVARRRRHGRAAAPVRLVHLGLGNFFRAHQAWYTDRAPDADGLGHRRVHRPQRDAGRRASPPRTASTRWSPGPRDGDRFEVVSSLSRAHAAADHDAWLRLPRPPRTCARSPSRSPRPGTSAAPTAASTATAPRCGPTSRRCARIRPRSSAPHPARLVAGLAARRRADAGPLALVPCDNLPGNGAVAARVVRDLAELVDPGLAGVDRRSPSRT